MWHLQIGNPFSSQSNLSSVLRMPSWRTLNSIHDKACISPVFSDLTTAHRISRPSMNLYKNGTNMLSAKMHSAYTALWRKAVGKKVLATIPKGIVGDFEFTVFKGIWKNMVLEPMDVCFRVLKESNKRRFDSYIVENCNFRDCRVHIFSDSLSRDSCLAKMFVSISLYLFIFDLCLFFLPYLSTRWAFSQLFKGVADCYPAGIYEHWGMTFTCVRCFPHSPFEIEFPFLLIIWATFLTVNSLRGRKILVLNAETLAVIRISYWLSTQIFSF